MSRGGWQGTGAGDGELVQPHRTGMEECCEDGRGGEGEGGGEKGESLQWDGVLSVAEAVFGTPEELCLGALPRMHPATPLPFAQPSATPSLSSASIPPPPCPRHAAGLGTVRTVLNAPLPRVMELSDKGPMPAEKEAGIVGSGVAFDVLTAAGSDLRAKLQAEVGATWGAGRGGRGGGREGRGGLGGGGEEGEGGLRARAQ